MKHINSIIAAATIFSAAAVAQAETGIYKLEGCTSDGDTAHVVFDVSDKSDALKAGLENIFREEVAKIDSELYKAGGGAAFGFALRPKLEALEQAKNTKVRGYPDSPETTPGCSIK